MITGRLWALFRTLLFVSGLTLVSYVVYRYSLAHPPEHGSLYGTIFPLSLLLALAGMALAWGSVRVARWLGAGEVRPEWAGEPVLGVAGD